MLRYSCHSADISALALATKLKLAAVADESGTLSLLDLLQVWGAAYLLVLLECVMVFMIYMSVPCLLKAGFCRAGLWG